MLEPRCASVRRRRSSPVPALPEVRVDGVGFEVHGSMVERLRHNPLHLNQNRR